MTALRYIFSILMIPVSFIAAGTGLVAFMAGHVNPLESTWVTLAGLLMPVILIINFIILIYWLIGKRGWFIIPAMAIVLNIGYLSSVFQLSPSSPKIPQGRASICMASYNVAKFKSPQKYNTQHLITEFLLDHQVNIACFQEYTEHSKINADSLDKLLSFPYHAITYLPGSTTSGIGIFSKFPILRSGSIPFNSRTNNATWVDVRIGEETIRVISYHLQTTNFSRKRKKLTYSTLQDADARQLESVTRDITRTLLSNSRIRAEQVDQVRQIIDTTRVPVIVCGDLNDLPSSYTYHQIKRNLNDSFRSRGNGYEYTFRGIYRLLRIDFIFYSPRLTCIAHDSPPREWSDHNPVISEFYLP